MFIRRDDVVEVITGDDRGRRAKVLSVKPRKGKAVVEGVNRVYKHLRRSRKNPQGGRLEIEAAMNLSNLQLVCTKCDKAVRTGTRTESDGKKHRVCRKCGADLGEL
ncbi:MAG: 50S ribosomal protein L24 [Planctomycetota bacterium]|jgi:large subunit ribosomal protein L24|nr:50S ribosomal protein L24 [Planctomycetota bacterium]